jgi:type III secretory pathway component EscT
LGGVSAALEAALALALPLWISLWLIDATLALVARAVGHTEPLARAPLRSGLSLVLLGLWLGPVSAHAPGWLRGALTAAGAALARLAR